MGKFPKSHVEALFKNLLPRHNHRLLHSLQKHLLVNRRQNHLLVHHRQHHLLVHHGLVSLKQTRVLERKVVHFLQIKETIMKMLREAVRKMYEKTWNFIICIYSRHRGQWWRKNKRIREKEEKGDIADCTGQSDEYEIEACRKELRRKENFNAIAKERHELRIERVGLFIGGHEEMI